MSRRRSGIGAGQARRLKKARSASSASASPAAVQAKAIQAVFAAPDKQKFVTATGEETVVPTLWVYFDDGTFEQYATIDGEDVLFSSGDYKIDGTFDKDGSMLTLHRTKKYDAAKGLADYDSAHDYKMGELGYTRIFPTPAIPTI